MWLLLSFKWVCSYTVQFFRSSTFTFNVCLFLYLHPEGSDVHAYAVCKRFDVNKQRHDMQNNTKNDLGKKLFSMVVVADTHLSEQDMESNSPFAVNRLANGRMKHVVQDINALKPDFVINLGDLIHPVPGVPNAYADAVERFLEQTAELNCPQYLVPGNHDVGDKPIDWAPAGVVCDEYLGMWERYFGDHYYAFTHHQVHFIVVNASLINTGLAAEAKQREWLQDYLAENAGSRFMINIHYPPFLTHTQEPEHYDNIAEPGRSWLLELMESYQVEALFAGHVHNFWYNRHHQTDCYLLPSTAFVRQDYSEMYRVPPNADEEHGRNENAKLGYMSVDIYERGHVCHSIRTHGQLGGKTALLDKEARTQSVHPAQLTSAPLGFDLRQTWSEVLEIPPSGGLDEFIRKPVRNDYPLMAIWEMGVKKLRVPLQDLQDNYVRSRLETLQKHGQEFTVFSFGLLKDQEKECLLAHQSLIESWELAYADQDIVSTLEQLQSLSGSLQVPTYLSRLHTHSDTKQSGDRYFHVINHGFTLKDEQRLQSLMSEYDLPSLIEGFVMRISLAQDAWLGVQEADAMAKRLGVAMSLHLRLGEENPAIKNCDDRLIAGRIGKALISASACADTRVFVDTFADNDRGYFVKNGAVDRRYNPRLAGLVIKHLYSQLRNSGELRLIDQQQLANAQVNLFASATKYFALLLPEQAMYLNKLNIEGLQALTDVQLVDLKTGAISDIGFSQLEEQLNLDDKYLYDNPALLVLS